MITRLTQTIYPVRGEPKVVVKEWPYDKEFCMKIIKQRFKNIPTGALYDLNRRNECTIVDKFLSKVHMRLEFMENV